MRYRFDDKEFGLVIVYTRRDARRVKVRWDGDHLKLTVPEMLPNDSILQIFESMRDDIRLLKRNTVTFSIGQTIQCIGCSIAIGRQNTKPHSILYGQNHDDDNYYINLPADINLDSEIAKKQVSLIIGEMIAHAAKYHLLPLAQEVADRLSVAVARFEVGRGMRKLGHCTSKGVIQLSRNLMLLPRDLAEYIICHELAHITYPNHSPQFHALVNQYTDGHEKELEKRLRAFSWPIIQ